MTPNKSLLLSQQINSLMQRNLLQIIEPLFPHKVVENYRKDQELNSRDRIFNEEITLLTMIISAIHEDKTLQNSVNILQEIHTKSIDKIIKYSQKQVEEEKLHDLKNNQSKVGRPKLYRQRIKKSKIQPISSNTAAYSKARKRLDLKLIDEVFNVTKDFREVITDAKWRQRDVFITDGTYFQMQDSEELKHKYSVRKNLSGKKFAYPQGLLQAIIHQGTGSVFEYQISSRGHSELELLFPLMEKIPKKSLLLADDLYNSFIVFALLAERQIDIIVPGKRKRIYQVIDKIGSDDEIIEITRSAWPSWLRKDYLLPTKLTLRRIRYTDVNNPQEEHVIYTSILDKSINKNEIINKYNTRWDIEITIREIKTLMGISIARSKTEEMVFKEMKVALIAYNLLRKVIAQASTGSAFSPKEDIIQEYFETCKNTLIDKKGRVYNRWSPGRYTNSFSQSSKTLNTNKTL
jgi:hypothetical protein